MKCLKCPRCSGEQIVKNGFTQNKKQNYKCRDCGRQFVENPKPYRMPAERVKLVDKLLLERLPLMGIVRTTGVSKRWLQYYVNKKYQAVPQYVNSHLKKRTFDNRM